MRAQREYEKLKMKISEASQTSFDELSEKPLTPGEMEQSLIGVASDVRPTKDGLDSPISKKFMVNEKTGEKTRLSPNNPRSASASKAERRKERSLAFWDRL